jgi:AcrR family transcriptional regulator
MSTAAPVGRPRDPLLEQRVQEAACRVFGTAGWTRFSIEAVAREAGVGKASIYLRWSSKAELLSDALTARLRDPEDVDTGSVRGDLVELARHHLALYTGDLGGAALRLTTEAQHIPELAPRWQAVRDGQVLASRAIVRRAIERGELPADASVTLLLDALFGAVVMHRLTTPDELLPRLQESVDAYAASLVDFLLAAVTGHR